MIVQGFYCMDSHSISVIMPALNEEQNIELAINATLQTFTKLNIDGEIVVINDGSTDNTGKILEDLKNQYENIVIITHQTPRGIGKSFMEGVRKATKTLVVMLPGDNENDPSDALNFLFLMNEVDIVVPFIQNIEVRNRFRRILSSFYRFIINISFGINLNYTNGTVLYRRCIFNNIEVKNSGFLYQAEILVKLLRIGYLFAEVPNYLKLRSTGKSKALTILSFINVCSGYLQLMWDIHVKRIESAKGYRVVNTESVTYIKNLKLNNLLWADVND